MFAYLAGAALVLVGLIGFAVDTTFDTGSGIDGDRLIVFEVNGLHNLVHIAPGLLLLAVAPKRATARLGVIAFGVIYGIVTLIGLIDGETVLGLLPRQPRGQRSAHPAHVAALLAGFVSSDDDRHGARGGDRPPRNGENCGSRRPQRLEPRLPAGSAGGALLLRTSSGSETPELEAARRHLPASSPPRPRRGPSAN